MSKRSWTDAIKRSRKRVQRNRMIHRWLHYGPGEMVFDKAAKDTIWPGFMVRMEGKWSKVVSADDTSFKLMDGREHRYDTSVPEDFLFCEQNDVRLWLLNFWLAAMAVAIAAFAALKH